MSVTPLPVSRSMTAEDKRAAARRDLEADPTLTGAAIAERYDMTGGWGRARRRDFLAAQSGTAAAQPPVPRDATPEPASVPRHDVEPVTETPVVPRHDPQPSQALLLVTKLAVAVVAAVAAVVSYSHTRDLALSVGQNPMLASLLPLSVDGLVVVGSTSLLIDRQYGRSGSPWAGLAVTIGLAASLAANVVSVDPGVVEVRTVRWVMAAYAPVALAISGHLLLQMLDHGGDQ